jgi:hypothetical protein
MGAGTRERVVTIAAVAACLVVLLGAGYIDPNNAPLPVPGVQNGFLPDYLLTPVTPTCRAENHAASDLSRLLGAAAAAGITLTADECYRDYAGQVYWRNYYCSLGTCQLAAPPGTSMHGWGKAVDFGDGTDNFGFSSPGYKWLKANVGRFNFNHPGWAEPGTDSPEPWHWEWVGDGGTLFGRIHHATASAGEVARNADGRLEAFGVGADHSVRHLWQQASSSNGWSGVNGLGGSLVAGSLQVIANDDGRLELFGTDADNRTFHTWQVAPNSAWSGFTQLGDQPATAPAVGRNDDGRLELFSVDSTGALWHIWQVAPNSAWSAPAVLGTGFAGPPGLAATDDGRLTVFAVGADGALRGTAQTTPNGSWSSLVNVGSNTTGRPGIGINLDGRIEVFVRGTDHRLWHAWQGTLTASTNAAPLSMSALTPLGDQVLSQSPTVSRNPDGRLEVFAVDNASKLGHAWQAAPNAGWSGWEVLSTTTFAGSPSLAMNADGRLEVFAGSPAPALWNSWQVAPNSSWSGFQQLVTGLSL